MVLLKIDDSQAFIYDESGKRKLVSQITPEDISSALEHLLNSDQVDIDLEADAEKILDPAQKIIFQQLRTSFKEAIDSRERILEEVDSTFSEAEKKYLS